MRPLLAAPLLLLVACAALPPRAGDDPDARRETGRIVSKRVLGDGRGDGARRHIPVTVGNRVIMIDLAQPAIPPWHAFHAYVVKLTDGRLVQVFGDYPGYRAGDCVRVLVSENPAYPRFDLGGHCDP